MTENQLRKKIIALCLQMNATGLNQGTSGNISARFNEFMLITPSGIPYEDLVPADIAKMKIDEDDFVWKGPSKPSSECSAYPFNVRNGFVYFSFRHTGVSLHDCRIRW